MEMGVSLRLRNYHGGFCYRAACWNNAIMRMSSWYKFYSRNDENANLQYVEDNEGAMHKFQIT